MHFYVYRLTFSAALIALVRRADIISIVHRVQRTATEYCANTHVKMVNDTEQKQRVKLQSLCYTC